MDTAIQVHGGNGMTTEYGVATLLGGVRAGRIAPVSREMILNFVAQHVLGQEELLVASLEVLARGRARHFEPRPRFSGRASAR